jgi:hypothetical protein
MIDELPFKRSIKRATTKNERRPATGGGPGASSIAYRSTDERSGTGAFIHRSAAGASGGQVLECSRMTAAHRSEFSGGSISDQAATRAHIHLFPLTPVHVHVHSGGQAVVGVVENSGKGSQAKSEDQCDATQIAHAPQPAMRSAHTERQPLPVASNAERPLPNARRNISGSAEGK